MKKSSSKSSLKRQISSPYLQIDSNGKPSKFSASRSPKRKNKSIDMIKIRNNNAGVVATRNKLGGTF